MVSEEARRDWQAFRDGMANPVVAQELLNAFVIGVHRRAETVYAHELKLLADQAGLRSDAQERLAAFIEPALALLAAYDRVLGADGGDDGEWYGGEHTSGPGDLVV